jgi:hypothetical protein
MVGGAASVIFDTSQHLGVLTLVGGSASFSASAGAAAYVTSQSLSVTSDGRLDLGDDDLIWDYGGSSPLGSWNGSAYDGITGLIVSGRNGGNGSGILTSAASGDLKVLGVAEASQVLNISGIQTALFGSETVDATTALVKFTYGGDANLDGKINIDDYGHIDTSVGIGVTGWFNGDFNYDGKINIDDYGIIDVNVGIQGAPLAPAVATNKSAAMGMLSGSVPEPAIPADASGASTESFGSAVAESTWWSKLPVSSAFSDKAARQPLLPSLMESAGEDVLSSLKRDA